jgi:hypothetical protein
VQREAVIKAAFEKPVRPSGFSPSWPDHLFGKPFSPSARDVLNFAMVYPAFRSVSQASGKSA